MSIGLGKVVENGERTVREEQGAKSDGWVKKAVYKGFGI